MTRLLQPAFFLLVLSLFSCAATRKISQVGLRDPNSIARSPGSVESIQELRKMVSAMAGEALPGQCPQELRDFFPLLASERVVLPACPKGFQLVVQENMKRLKVDERALLDDIGNSNCQNFENNGDNLLGLLNNFDSTGPLGRRARILETMRAADGEMRELMDLKKGLELIANTNLPLSRWVKENGSEILPNRDFPRLYDVIVKRGCSLDSYDVEEAYETLQRLEDLSRLLQDERQKELFLPYLGGLHRLLDNRIMEFFFPNGRN